MAGWADLDNFLHAVGVNIAAPTLGQTTGGQHVPNSNHYKGLARDYGDVDSDCSAVAQALLPHTDQLLELYFAPLGIWYPTNVGGHGDHVHTAIRPDGVLPTAVQPAPPTPHYYKESDMFLFWHKDGGLHLCAGGKTSRGGMAPSTCDALIAAGIPVVGNPGDDHSDIIDQFPPA